MTSPAAIAQRLTPAQVRALQNLTPNWPPSLVGINLRTVWALEKRRLVETVGETPPHGFGWRYAPTPLGMAVLTELERMERGL